MALKALASIISVKDIVSYAAAELAEAKKYCPLAASAYVAAYSLADQYAKRSLSAAEEAKAVDTVRQTIYGARQVWYASGCKQPGGTTLAAGTPSDVKPPDLVPVVVSEGGFGLGSWLLVGLGVAALYFLGKSTKMGKGKVRKPRKRRSTGTRRARRVRA